MVVLAKKLAIHAGIDAVWDMLTDPENERKYWTNVRDVKVISTDGNTVQREATVGPRGFAQRTKQTLTLNPKRSISLSIAGESVSGERAILVSSAGANQTNVEVVWNLQLKRVPGFVDGIVKGQVSKITEDALRRIASEAERLASREAT